MSDVPAPWSSGGDAPVSPTVGWCGPDASVADPVVLHFQLSKREVVGALRWRVLRSGPVYVALVCGVLSVALGAAQTSAEQEDDWILLGIFFLALTATVILFAPSQAWRRNPAIGEPQSIAFSEEGIQTRTPFTESRSAWMWLSAAFETPHCYLLAGRGRLIVLFVPRRAFASMADEARFRDLVAHHTAARLRPGPSAP